MLASIWPRYERAILSISGFVFVIALWEIGARTGHIREIFFSSPTKILQSAYAAVETGDIWGDVGTSLLTFAIGYSAGVIFGSVLGFVIGWYRRANYLFDPWISALYATPDIALVPLFILVLGVGIGTNSFIVFLSAVFPVTINVLVGTQSVDPRLMAVGRAFSARQLFAVRTIVLPSIFPFLLTGMRQASGRALVGVVVAEYIASNQGIGYMMSIAGATLNSARLWVGLILLGTFGIILGEILRRIEHHYDAWRPSTTRQ